MNNIPNEVPIRVPIRIMVYDLNEEEIKKALTKYALKHTIQRFSRKHIVKATSPQTSTDQYDTNHVAFYLLLPSNYEKPQISPRQNADDLYSSLVEDYQGPDFTFQQIWDFLNPVIEDPNEFDVNYGGSSRRRRNKRLSKKYRKVKRKTKKRRKCKTKKRR